MNSPVSRWRLPVQLTFVFIFAAMVAVTTWASLEKNLWQGFEVVLAERWGAATLADAYFGFVTFWLWVVYKETTWLARMIWLAVILFFGNLAMSGYVLYQIYRLPKGASIEALLLKRSAGQPHA